MRKYIFLIVACCLVIGTMVYGIVINNQNKVNTDLSMTNQTLIEKIDTTREDYEKLKLQYEQLKNESGGTISSLEFECNKLKESVFRAKELISDLQQERLELSLENSSLKEQISNLDTTNAEQKTQIENLQSQIDTNNAKIAELENTELELKNEKAELEKQIQELENKNSALLKENADYENQIKEFEEKLQAMVLELNENNNLYQKLVTREITQVTAEDLEGITEIGPYAFAYCENLTPITIPDGVTGIGAGCFANCENLTSITIPDSVTSIGASCFANCYQIENVVDGVRYVKTTTSDFDVLDGSIDVQLTEITISDKCRFVSGSALSNCRSLTSITIPDSVTSIGELAFCNCSSLTSITIPDSVTSIGEKAFYNCSNLETVRLSDNLTTLSDFLFYNCSNLTKFNWPKNLQNLGYGVFQNTGIVSIEIPEGVTSIKSNIVQMSEKLESIVFPSTLESLGNASFRNCVSLKSITFLSSKVLSGMKADIFRGFTSTTVIIYVPYGTAKEFKAHPSFANSAYWAYVVELPQETATV